MAVEFLQGLAASRNQMMGELQATEAFEVIKGRRRQAEKAERVQNYLGQYQQPGADQAAIESGMLGDAPELATKLRDWRTTDEAQMSDRLGELAAVASRAIGTPEEPQAMAWLGMEAEKIGVPRETVQEVLTVYSQNPEQGRLAVQSLVARGMGAKEYLAQYETPGDIAKGKRAQAGKVRLATLKGEQALTLEGAKQEGRVSLVGVKTATDIAAEKTQQKNKLALEGLKLKSSLTLEETRQKGRLEIDIAEQDARLEQSERIEAIKQANRLELEEVKQKGKAPSARVQKINDAMTDYGVSKKEARDIVDGRLTVKVDALSGETKLVNIATGTEKIVTGAAPPVSEIEGAPEVGAEVTPEPISGVPEKTLFESLEGTVGIPGVMKEAWAVTGGQLFGDSSPETTKARTKMKTLKNSLTVALATTGRPLSIELKNIVDMLPSTGMWESEGHATDVLTELHSILSRKVMFNKESYDNKSNPKKLRIEAKKKYDALTQVLIEIGTPPEDDLGITDDDQALLNKYAPGGS